MSIYFDFPKLKMSSDSSKVLHFYFCTRLTPKLKFYYKIFSVAIPGMCIQSCPTICDPMDCSPPGCSVHRILQVRILEWVVISFSRDLSNPGIKPRSPTLQADSLPSEPQASLLFLLVVCLFVRRTCSG